MQILVKIYVTAFPMCLFLFLGSFMIFLISFYIYFDFWTRNTYFLEQFVGHDKILKNSSNHMEKPSGFEVLVPKKIFFLNFEKISCAVCVSSNIFYFLTFYILNQIIADVSAILDHLKHFKFWAKNLLIL